MLFLCHHCDREIYEGETYYRLNDDGEYLPIHVDCYPEFCHERFYLQIKVAGEEE